MRIYLAGERLGTSKIIADGVDNTVIAVWITNVKRRLFSFYYHGFSGSKAGANFDKDGDIADSIARGHDLFLDSGAFTAFTKGVEIPLEEYAEFVKKNNIWTTASSVDHIGSGEEAAQRSYSNFIELRKLGADIQPVWHVREPDHWLERYIKDGWNYIFIGGMVPETTEWLLERLDHLWNGILTDADGTARVKIHGFGLTDQKLMFRYPWFSVDSSSWLMTGIFGACLFRMPSGKLRKVVFSEDSPEARKWRGWHYFNLPKSAKDEVDRWLIPYGVTAAQCASHYSFRDVINAAVFQNLEDMGTNVFQLQQPKLFT